MMTRGSITIRQSPAGLWSRSLSEVRACQIPRYPPPPYTPVIHPAEPVECAESYIAIPVPPVRLVNYKATLVRDGAAELHGSFGTVPISTGDLVLFPVGLVCGSRPITPLDVVSVYFNPALVADQMRWALSDSLNSEKESCEETYRLPGGMHGFRLSASQYRVFDSIFDRLLCLSQRRASLGEKFVAATQLIWLINDMFRAAPMEHKSQSPALPAPVRREIRAVLDLLQRDYRSGWSTTDLAQYVSLSESALRRAFQRATGMSPKEYLHRVRLMRFEQLIASSDVSIGEAARRVGWDSADYARRVFERNHGMTPREFRAEYEGRLAGRCAGGCVLSDT